MTRLRSVRWRGLVHGTVSVALCGILAFLPEKGSGAWVRNHPKRVVQPDGAVLQCFTSGDEFNNWLHDGQGYTIIQDPASAYYVYAVLQAGTLAPSPHIAGRVDPVSLGLPVGLNISAGEMASRRHATGQETVSVPVQPFRANVLNNIVVFIHFAGEVGFPDSITRYERLFNSVRDGANSVVNYFSEVSYGQLIVSSSFYPVSGDNVLSYQDTLSRDYYRKFNATTNPIGYVDDAEGLAREQSLVIRTLRSIKAQIPAALDIDGNDNGIVDNVCLVLSGDLEGGGNRLLWPHTTELPPQSVLINGKDVRQYNVQIRSFVESESSGGVAVLCHELFHSLGAPDLYRYSFKPPDPVGPWDLMAAPSNPPVHMGAYMKFKYGGWIPQMPTISSPGTYTLHALSSGGVNCYKIPTPFSTEYFVIEYRRRAGTFERSVPGEGVLVYRVNETRIASNATGPPDELYLYRPGGTLNADGVIDSAAYSFNSGRVAITDLTVPSGFLSTGAFSGLSIVEVGPLGDSISFTIGGKLVPFVSTASGVNVDVGDAGDTINVTLTNPDPVPLTVTSVLHTNQNFTPLLPNLPLIVGPSMSVAVKTHFRAGAVGYYRDTVILTGSNPHHLLSRVFMTARAVIVPAAHPNTLYALSQGTPSSNGSLFVVDARNGQAREVGRTGTWNFRGLRVNPRTHQLVAMSESGQTSPFNSAAMNVFRINSDDGEAYGMFSFALPAASGDGGYLTDGLAFRDDSTAYTSYRYWRNGYEGATLCRIRASAELVGEHDYDGMIFRGLAFAPNDKSRVWVVARTFSPVRDSLCTLDLQSWEVKSVSALGAVSVSDITFDESGRLYGVTSADTSRLLEIDTSTGTIRTIGAMGSYVVALAAEGVVAGIENELELARPMRFRLDQNYPNPFNPSTTIRYGLPERSHVTLAVYNTLGQQVAVLQNGEQEAGYHDVKFEASNLPSGVYFYRMQAGSYVETKKLCLVR
jgi:M6 family metalloprotease-like protein